jgi:hypothetical protein
VAFIVTNNVPVICGQGLVQPDPGDDWGYIIYVASADTSPGCGQLQSHVQFYFPSNGGLAGRIAPEYGIWAPGDRNLPLAVTTPLPAIDILPGLAADSIAN